MALSFRKRIKLSKGVHLNLSKSGIGFSVGTKGASVSVGKKGTYLNTSIPGTGIYSRQKIGASKKQETHSTEGSGSLLDCVLFSIKLLGFLAICVILLWMLL